jgi:ABC-type multidrug transport system permease subunit
MSSGKDYLAQIGYDYAHRWRDWGVFLCFATINIATCFAATWWMRIRPLYK